MEPRVERVIKIFTAISKQLDTEYLAYWALPNAVLTLSGARAYCDGIFWTNKNEGLLEKWKTEITESIEVIKRQIVIVWSDARIEESHAGEKYAGYELITEDGLRSVLAHTNLFSNDLFDEIKALKSAKKQFERLVKNLKAHSKFRKYTEESLRHIAFGVLAGYPEKAILESVLKWDEADPFAETLVNADIRGAGYYICPQPVYSYPRHLMNDPDIVKHEKLWSNLLKDYYRSDFHRSLEKDKKFQHKMRELGNIA